MICNIDNLFKIDPRNLVLFLTVQDNVNTNREEQIATLIYSDLQYNKLLEEGWLKIIKGKKGDSDFKKLRLDTKAKKYLSSLSELKITEETKTLEEWLHKIYVSRPNYVKSNRKQTQRLLEWFSNETNIWKNELGNLLGSFLNDTFVSELKGQDFWTEFNNQKESNPRLQLSNKLENIIWYSKDPYKKKPELSESLLYSYYQDNKEYIDNKYNKYLNK